MIILFSSFGSDEIILGKPTYSSETWNKFKEAIFNNLRKRTIGQAPDLFLKYPFDIYSGTNSFLDQFHLLYFEAQTETYLEIAELANDRNFKFQFELIAKATNEITNKYIRFVAVELDETKGIYPTLEKPSLEITSDVVERALRDAERLLKTEGATSSVDRIHTALHGYLKSLAEHGGIQSLPNDDITKLFKTIRTKHPAFQTSHPQQDDIDKVLNSIANILHALNPLRNNLSVAHPNETLLDEAEAMLVINCVKSLLYYLNRKTRV